MLKESDAVVYSTIERTKLARAARHIQESGTHLRSLSEMIRIIVDVFDEWLNKQGVPPIESTHEATEILQHMFRASLNPGERKAKQLLRNLQQDSFGEMEEFNKYPKQRGKQPEWTASDDARMMQAAEKALKYPNIQKLLKENNGQGDSK